MLRSPAEDGSSAAKERAHRATRIVTARIGLRIIHLASQGAPPRQTTEAPTAGSVILAGILLKMGAYGFLRVTLPILPDAVYPFRTPMLVASAVAIVYGAYVTLSQTDMKRLIAYSSVSHLGFCMLGLFALNPLGLQGGTLQMVNHGLSTGGLFAIVGMLYERYHTREISQLGGLAKRVPWLAFFMLLFTFSSMNLPSSSSKAWNGRSNGLPPRRLCRLQARIAGVGDD